MWLAGRTGRNLKAQNPGKKITMSEKGMPVNVERGGRADGCRRHKTYMIYRVHTWLNCKQGPGWPGLAYPSVSGCRGLCQEAEGWELAAGVSEVRHSGGTLAHLGLQVSTSLLGGGM